MHRLYQRLSTCTLEFQFWADGFNGSQMKYYKKLKAYLSLHFFSRIQAFIYLSPIIDRYHHLFAEAINIFPS